MKKLMFLMALCTVNVASAGEGVLGAFMGNSSDDLVSNVAKTASAITLPCFLDGVDWSAAAQNYVPGYTDYLTEGEIADLLAFYKSDLGQKSLEILPLLVGDSMKMTSLVKADALPPLVKGCLD